MNTYEEVRAAGWYEAPTTQKQIDAMYETNCDFQMFRTGQYINKADAEKYGVTLMVRYGKGYSKVYTPKGAVK